MDKEIGNNTYAALLIVHHQSLIAQLLWERDVRRGARYENYTVS